MKKTYMIVDIDRCYGCKSCQVACKREHGIGGGEGNSIEVIRVERLSDMGEVLCDFLPSACLHCDDALCIDACPTNAIFRDEEGLVQIDKKLCIGCSKCVKVCDYGAVYMIKGENKKYANKCDLCKRRRGMGLKTACEQHCIGAVFAVTDDLNKALNAKKYCHKMGSTIYISDKIDFAVN